MINGAHVIIYSRDAEADRTFFRDVLAYPHVDAGDGWLIFRLPPAELAFHPAAGDQRQELYLMCDNITQTVDELTGRGVEFARPITDAGWGRTTALRLPGGAEVGLYQPRHPTAHDITP